MIEIGRKCVKLAGRDAGKSGIIVDIQEGNLVLIDGEVRRRKCNIVHLELLDEVVKISKGASSEEVAKALGIEIKKSEPKKKIEKPKKQRGKKKAEEAKKGKAKKSKSVKKAEDKEGLEALAEEPKKEVKK